MAIPFPLTRSRLQALIDCRRRFWLQSVHQLPWPAAQPAGAEQALARGREFHRLMERHFLGLTVEPIAPNLRPWWVAWQTHPLPLPPGRALPEITLTAPEMGERLLVRYDLLVIPADVHETVLIVDWKTTARPRPRAALQRDIQTRLYPYVLVEAGSAVAGRDLRPDQIELIYWQTAAPSDPVRFPYSAADHQSNRRDIRSLIDRAHTLQPDTMPPVIDDLHICARCPYRTYCRQPLPTTPH
jgi:hypothetical protein